MLSKLKIFVLLIILLNANVYAQQATGTKSQQLGQPQSADSTKVVAKPKATSPKWTYKIIDAPNKTFCYDIYADGILKIHQPNIPAVPGNNGFKTKADAEKVAQLVIKKIKKGEMPPTVTVEEMKKLKVIK